jgi:hypothetical protein
MDACQRIWTIEVRAMILASVYKKSGYSFLIILIGFICTRTSLAFSGSFESLYSIRWSDGIDKRLVIQAPSTRSLETEYDPNLCGFVMRACINKGDDFRKVNGVPRAEVAFSNVPRFSEGKDYQVSWSMLIPEKYQFDHLQPEIVMQIHQSSNSGSPPFSLILDGSKYRLQLRGGAMQSVLDITFGDVTPDVGRMTNWMLHYKPDNSGRSAITELYRNGELMFKDSGYPNAYAGETHSYLKLGIYKWWWLTRASEVTERCLYYGNVDVRQRSMQ